MRPFSKKRVLAIATLALPAWMVGLPAAMAESNSLSGKVRGILLDNQFDSTGSAYHLLIQGRNAGSRWQSVIRKEVQQTLADRAYGPEKPLLAADVAIVVRYGSQPHKADIDAVLAGADPDAPLTSGTRFLRIEAYDMNGFLTFSEQLAEQSPSADVADFMLWVTTVSSAGAVDQLTDILPHMITQATAHLSTEANLAFTTVLP